MTITAKQFGFATASGVVANMVDGDLVTYWRPLATDFAAYSAQFFLSDKVTLNVGASFPALEFDLGEAQRVPQFLFKTQTMLTLGPSILIGSDVGATSPADTLQSSDILLGQYSGAEMCSNGFLVVPVMRDADIRKRFLRFLQRSSDPSVVAPTPGPANSVTYDDGEGAWQVVNYSTKLIIETWGGGASGGISSKAQNGGATTAARDVVPFLITANGGVKATATAPNTLTGAGTGGTASGANVSNVTGGAGSVPSNNTGAVGSSGAGGDAPNGGLGGEGVSVAAAYPGQNFYYGKAGQSPGAGGSGHSFWAPVGGPYFFKCPGGGSGGYARHEITRGSGDAEPGDFIAYHVGAGGVSTDGDGRGAPGRVRFSWT
jgi:hypothetical protein